MVFHVYKNRRGKLVRVKVWCYVDLSTCRTYDILVTDRHYNPIPVARCKIQIE